jgi:hypothetical protein
MATKLKIEKKGDEILIVHCCFSVSQNWLKIEQFWPFEKNSIFSNGGHLGYRTALTDKILKGADSVSAVLYPRWPPLLKIEISSNGQNCSILSQKVPNGHLGYRTALTDTILKGDHLRIISAKFG